MKELMAQYDSIDNVYKTLQIDHHLKVSNVLSGMAPDFRILS